MCMNTNQNNLIDRLTIDSKSILAKLMASENFTVEHHENAQTAYFDTRNRVLVLPMWQNVSEELYNMLVGHEVGHALFTPTNAVRDGINYIDPVNQESAKDFWNIVEDARIERLIKDKFPGLRRDFSRAYKEIYSSDRFGLNTLLKNPEKLHTIDKLNLKAKLGVHADATVDLTEDEQKFYDRMMSTQTHDEVLVLAKEIYEFCKNQMNQPQSQPQNQSGDSQESDDSSESNGEKSGQSKNSGKSKQGKSKQGKPDKNKDGKPSQSQSGNDSENESDQENQQNSGSGGDSDDSENSGDTESISSPYDMDSQDRTLDEEEIENLSNQVGSNSGSKSQSSSKSVSVSVPRSDLSKLEEMARSNQNASGEDSGNEQSGNKNNNKVIGVKQSMAGEQNNSVPTSTSMGQYTQFINSLPSNVKEGVVYYDLPTLDSDKIVVPFKKVMEDFSVLNKLGQSYFDHIYSKFMAETKDWISNAVMEFDRRKAADAHARTSTAKTGALNTSKLQNYKFSEDLFKRVSVTKNGKNHGIVMIIDWSGSMDTCMGSTIKQLLNLVMFCRKTSIPFEVYAFSDGYSDANNSRYGANTVPNLGSKYPSIQYCRLINFLSYKMNSIEMKTMFNYLLHLSQMYNRFDYFSRSEMSGSHPSMIKTMANIPAQYSLNGTPLNTSILYSFDLLKKFQKKTGVQIMNYVVLTDGEDSYGFASEYGKTTVLRDKATKNQVAFQPGRNGGRTGSTSCILNMLRKNVGCSAVGYYLIPSSNGKAILASLMGIAADTNEGRKKLDIEVERFKKDHHAVVTNAGYDSYFIIPSDQMNQVIQQHDSALSKNVTAGMVDMSKTKKNRRIILTKFIDIISKQIKDSYHENLKSKM